MSRTLDWYARYKPQQINDKTLRAWDRIQRKNLIKDFLAEKQPPIAKQEDNLVPKNRSGRKDSVTTALHKLTKAHDRKDNSRIEGIIADVCGRHTKDTVLMSKTKDTDIEAAASFLSSNFPAGLSVDAKQTQQASQNKLATNRPSRLQLVPANLRTYLVDRRFSKICADEITRTLKENATAAQEELCEGTVVDALSIGEDCAHRGVVREDNGDGTFYIVFENGHHDRMIPRHSIKLVGRCEFHLCIDCSPFFSLLSICNVV